MYLAVAWNVVLERAPQFIPSLMRKQHSFIFKLAAAWSVLQIPRVFPRGSCYKSAKEIQSLHPGLKIGSKSQQIPRHARVCPRGPPPPPPGLPLISALDFRKTVIVVFQNCPIWENFENTSEN